MHHLIVAFETKVNKGQQTDFAAALQQDRSPCLLYARKHLCFFENWVKLLRCKGLENTQLGLPAFFYFCPFG
jgi:hypothetical protein